MRRWLKSTLLLGAVTVGVTGAGAAEAAHFSFSPSPTSPAVGSSFALDLVVSDLGAGGAPSAGGFDVTVAYDASAISFSGASFATFLGSAPAEATTDVVPAAGSVELAEVSFLAPAALDALQPASFTMATLRFVATSLSPSTVSLSGPLLLSDAFGNPIGVDGPLATVRITPKPGSAVPEPQAFLLYAAGLVGVARANRVRRPA